MTNPQKPLVSVVIATYNMARYVGDAITSVQRQTVDDLEIHVVDDGSSDDTTEVVSSFLTDRRVHYHRQSNAGQTKAKNVGVDAANGKYVGFCDADDLWLPNKLALQLPALETSPSVGLVYTRSQPIDSRGEELPRPTFPEPSGRVTTSLFMENFIPFGTVLVRTDALRKFGAFDERYKMGIDWELFLRLSLHYDFKCIPTVTYLYRIWEGQMSKNWKGRYDHAFRIMSNFIEANPSAIPAATVRKARALSFANRARARANISADYLGAIEDVLHATALGHSPYAALRLIARCTARIARLAHGPLDT